MTPRIFYHCYDHNRPTGGQKDCYQHVDVLNASGFEAFVVHAQKNFRVTWFDNATTVIDRECFARLFDARRDYIVLPEDLGPRILEYSGRKIIFNKNVYHGGRAILFADADPYQSSDVVAVFCVSEHNAEYLQLAYPEKRVVPLPYDIRAAAFPFRPLRDKRRQIAWMPKAVPQVAALRQILQARARASRNHLADFEWVCLQNMNERQMSETLSASFLLVFLSVEEGLPRVPLEAMAAGCLVVAYASGPLCECLPAGCGFTYGNLPAMVQFIEQACACHPDRCEAFDAIAANGRVVAETFSPVRQAETVSAAWKDLLRCEP